MRWNEGPDLVLGDLTQLPKQRFADSELSECLLHVEVLELRIRSDQVRSGISREGTDINSRLARPRRKVEEVQGEANRLV